MYQDSVKEKDMNHQGGVAAGARADNQMQKGQNSPYILRLEKIIS